MKKNLFSFILERNSKSLKNLSGPKEELGSKKPCVPFFAVGKKEFFSQQDYLNMLALRTSRRAIGEPMYFPLQTIHWGKLVLCRTLSKN